MRDRSAKRTSVALMVALCACLLPAIIYLSAPAIHLLHLLTVQPANELCIEQGQPAGFYPPGETIPEPTGRVVLDPFSVHCSYDDWLGQGPIDTVARGWPPVMASLTLIFSVGLVACIWITVRLFRRTQKGNYRVDQ